MVVSGPSSNRFSVPLLPKPQGQAQYLVTGDRHLLGLGSYEGIQIVTPAVFWQHLERERAARLARVQVRQAGEADTPRLLVFYQETGYTGGVDPADVVILAEEEGRIIGALRLCQEQGASERVGRPLSGYEAPKLSTIGDRQ